MAEQISLLEKINTEPRILVFDLETLRSATEVGGWTNIRRMGMACGVVYDSIDDEHRTYDEDRVQDLVNDLRRADVVIGFNHIGFDYEVLSAYSTFNLRTLPSFDLLLDLKQRLGHRVKLNSLAMATLGESKSADGLQSLRWVKEGRMDLVREYCKKDVQVTWDVFQYGRKHGQVRYDKYGDPASVVVNWDINQIIERIKKTS